MSGLSEQERAELLADNLALAYDNMHATWAQLTVVEVVDRIITAREKALAERIVRAIEQEGRRVVGERRRGMNHAARIARREFGGQS